MYVKEIYLENFRNYTKENFYFDRSGSYLCGRNGAGKTNLMESLYMLVYGKSFRTINLEEIVTHKRNFFRIKGVFGGSIEKTIEFRYQKATKKILVNNVEIKNIKELIGNIALTFFCLNDINLVAGEPAVRRKFIDSLLSLLYIDYLEDLLEYRKVLRQRNRVLYLRKIGERNNTEGIEGWTEELVRTGSRIIKKRLSIMDELNESSSFYYTLISPVKDKLIISYMPSFAIHNDIEENFRNALKKKQFEELERGMSLVGPHRDEFLFTINGFPARKFSSEGEQRSCALSLKIAQASFLKEKRGDNPILLIDEAIAELDNIRKERVLTNAVNIGQCIIGTADCDIIQNFLPLKRIDIDKHNSKH
ncbi:MAG: hypothetical protein B5M53_08535 [Candidatus Cloacimonas sp. 4484_209]|nr:MAG: hypothetical protein B5M53_08535 [Candidatus Cloacimonas sp. 4484_209]